MALDTTIHEILCGEFRDANHFQQFSSLLDRNSAKSQQRRTAVTPFSHHDMHNFPLASTIFSHFHSIFFQRWPSEDFFG
jgi:hypothetical protein